MVPGKGYQMKTSFCYNHCYSYILLCYLITFHLTSSKYQILSHTVYVIGNVHFIAYGLQLYPTEYL